MILRRTISALVIEFPLGFNSNFQKTHFKLEVSFNF